VRERGGYFIGATVLAISALLATDRDRAQTLVDEGEALARDGALSFNRFWFREIAIEAALARGDASRAREHAAALLAEEDLPPWPRSVAERAVLLARVAEGERGAAIETELAALLERTAAASLGPAARSLEAALRQLNA
jgi:hypothetical protein